MGVIECVGYGGNDRCDDASRYSARVVFQQQRGGVGPLDVIHGNPELAVGLAAVIYSYHVGMPQGGGQVGLSDKPLSVFVVGRKLVPQNFESVAAWQAGMLGQIHFAHSAGTQYSNNAVSGKERSLS